MRRPIPIRVIIEEMETIGHEESRTVRAVRGLVKNKYIRRAVDRSSRSSYVLLKYVTETRQTYSFSIPTQDEEENKTRNEGHVSSSA